MVIPEAWAHAQKPPALTSSHLTVLRESMARIWRNPDLEGDSLLKSNTIYYYPAGSEWLWQSAEGELVNYMTQYSLSGLHRVN